MAGGRTEGFLLARVGVPVVLRVGGADYELGGVDVPVFARPGDRQPGQQTAAVDLNVRLGSAEVRVQVAALLRGGAATLEEGSAHGG